MVLCVALAPASAHAASGGLFKLTITGSQHTDWKTRGTSGCDPVGAGTEDITFRTALKYVTMRQDFHRMRIGAAKRSRGRWLPAIGDGDLDFRLTPIAAKATAKRTDGRKAPPSVGGFPCEPAPKTDCGTRAFRAFKVFPLFTSREYGSGPLKLSVEDNRLAPFWNNCGYTVAKSEIRADVPFTELSQVVPASRFFSGRRSSRARRRTQHVTVTARQVKRYNSDEYTGTVTTKWKMTFRGVRGLELLHEG